MDGRYTEGGGMARRIGAREDYPYYPRAQVGGSSDGLGAPTAARTTTVDEQTNGGTLSKARKPVNHRLKRLPLPILRMRHLERKHQGNVMFQKPKASAKGYLRAKRSCIINKPELKKNELAKIQAILKRSGNDPYHDWKSGEAVPYATLCTTFSLC
jgi:DNA ligase-1